MHHSTTPLENDEWETLKKLLETLAHTAPTPAGMSASSRGEWRGNEWLTWLDVVFEGVMLSWPTTADTQSWRLLDAQKGVWIQVRVGWPSWKKLPTVSTWETLGAYPQDQWTRAEGPWWQALRNLIAHLKDNSPVAAKQHALDPVKRLSLEQMRSRFR